jgi:predicted GH43/DUF377 family glycosyl hydrolase
VGAELRPGNSASIATAAPTDQRQLAMDETYIRVKGEWRYLYRAVDSSGATIDLATTTDFIKMSEQVGGIFVNPCGTSALEFLLPVTAGQ